MKKKVLWITPELYPVSGGGQMYSLGNIREVSKYVDLKVIACITWAGLQEYKTGAPELEGLDVTVVTRYRKRNKLTKFNRPISKYIARKTGTVALYKNILNTLCLSIKQFKPEFIVIDYVGMYNYYFYLAKRFPSIKYIYQSQNAEYLNFGHIHLEKYGIKKIVSSYWVQKRKEYEHILLRDCYASLCISKYDMEIFQNEFKDCGNLIYAKPLIRFSKVKTIESVQNYQKKLLIVGSMDWYPNINGIFWFVNNVFCELVKKDPEYKLYLVGKKPDSRLKELAEQYRDHIILTGGVPSIDPYFEECDISIVPIFEGTGAKIKVLESIGKGIPTLCSEFAAKDYNISRGEIEVLKQSADAYLKAIAHIEADIYYREELVKRMDKYYSEYFNLNPQIQELFE